MQRSYNRPYKSQPLLEKYNLLIVCKKYGHILGLKIEKRSLLTKMLQDVPNKFKRLQLAKAFHVM